MIATRDILDAMYGRSPVPLYRFDTPDGYNRFADPYGLGGMTGGIRGRFVVHAADKELPQVFIVIIQNQPLVGELITYFHELGHYAHFMNGCECAEEPGILAEIHAQEYALNRALNEQFIGAVQWELLCMLDHQPDHDLSKFVIVDRLKKMPVWKKCLLALLKFRIEGDGISSDYDEAVQWLKQNKAI